MTINVRVHNIDEVSQRADVWIDTAQDTHANLLVTRLESRAGRVGGVSWPVLTGWSSAAFFFRTPRRSVRELHNAAPYARAVERGFRFTQGGHPSNMAQWTFQTASADPTFTGPVVRVADHYAALGDRGQHRPGLSEFEGSPIGVTAAALLGHRYAQIGPFPGAQTVAEFAQLLRTTRLSARTATPRGR